ncbi:HipA domain-containing protein [Xanthobacter autotrophicus DSM 431]|uniref:type II toxin-antitoxin system HipA family toxin n=1 Tax=Xanthobacter nonsaccharivorans TaxID=3119912 RepID=UPI00372A5804
MTSDAGPTEAFVWVWLPGETGPVVAGRLAATGNQLLFNYGRSYLARKNAIPLYEPELPLRAGVLPLLNGLHMPSCIRDAAPDAWGRRVILNRKLGVQGRDVDAASLDELTYLLEPGSDRIGALDFQTSAAKYVARDATPVSLDDLMNAAASIEKGLPLAPELDRALLHGSSIGGARPKAMLTSGDRKYVAKFSSQSDLYSVVKAEYVAMRLAAESGMTVAHVALERTAGKDVLLVERFDREKSTAGWQRRAMVSALTLLELDELMARYASYEDLATIVRHRFMAPRETLRELFSRMLFNILCGNTDDHARNHAAFWDGQSLALTPAYDICPQARAGGEATQAMLIAGNERWSRIVLCLDAAPLFLLSRQDAMALAEHQITVIRDGWAAICAEADLSEIDRNLLWRRQFLNPFAFEGAPPSLLALLA